jgi:hypothetical protein
MTRDFVRRQPQTFKRAKRFLCLYLTVAMALTQAMPSGWSQQADPHKGSLEDELFRNQPTTSDTAGKTEKDVANDTQAGNATYFLSETKPLSKPVLSDSPADEVASVDPKQEYQGRAIDGSVRFDAAINLNDANFDLVSIESKKDLESVEENLQAFRSFKDAEQVFACVNDNGSLACFTGTSREEYAVSFHASLSDFLKTKDTLFVLHNHTSETESLPQPGEIDLESAVRGDLWEAVGSGNGWTAFNQQGVLGEVTDEDVMQRLLDLKSIYDQKQDEPSAKTIRNQLSDLSSRTEEFKTLQKTISKTMPGVIYRADDTDTTPPTNVSVRFVSPDPIRHPSETYSRHALLNLSAEDPGSGVATFQYQLVRYWHGDRTMGSEEYYDWSPEIDFTSQYELELPNKPSDYYVWVKFKDNAGNWSHQVELSGSYRYIKFAPQICDYVGSAFSPRTRAVVQNEQNPDQYDVTLDWIPKFPRVEPPAPPTGYLKRAVFSVEWDGQHMNVTGISDLEFQGMTVPDASILKKGLTMLNSTFGNPGWTMNDTLENIEITAVSSAGNISFNYPQPTLDNPENRESGVMIKDPYGNIQIWWQYSPLPEAVLAYKGQLQSHYGSAHEVLILDTEPNGPNPSTSFSVMIVPVGTVTPGQLVGAEFAVRLNEQGAIVFDVSEGFLSAVYQGENGVLNTFGSGLFPEGMELYAQRRSTTADLILDQITVLWNPIQGVIFFRGVEGQTWRIFQPVDASGTPGPVQLDQVNAASLAALLDYMNNLTMRYGSKYHFSAYPPPDSSSPDRYMVVAERQSAAGGTEEKPSRIFFYVQAGSSVSFERIVNASYDSILPYVPEQTLFLEGIGLLAQQKGLTALDLLIERVHVKYVDEGVHMTYLNDADVEEVWVLYKDGVTRIRQEDVLPAAIETYRQQLQAQYGSDYFVRIVNTKEAGVFEVTVTYGRYDLRIRPWEVVNQAPPAEGHLVSAIFQVRLTQSGANPARIDVLVYKRLEYFLRELYEYDWSRREYIGYNRDEQLDYNRLLAALLAFANLHNIARKETLLSKISLREILAEQKMIQLGTNTYSDLLPEGTLRFSWTAPEGYQEKWYFYHDGLGEHLLRENLPREVLQYREELRAAGFDVYSMALGEPPFYSAYYFRSSNLNVPLLRAAVEGMRASDLIIRHELGITNTPPSIVWQLGNKNSDDFVMALSRILSHRDFVSRVSSQIEASRLPQMIRELFDRARTNVSLLSDQEIMRLNRALLVHIYFNEIDGGLRLTPSRSNPNTFEVSWDGYQNEFLHSCAFHVTLETDAVSLGRSVAYSSSSLRSAYYWNGQWNLLPMMAFSNGLSLLAREVGILKEELLLPKIRLSPLDGPIVLEGNTWNIHFRYADDFGVEQRWKIVLDDDSGLRVHLVDESLVPPMIGYISVSDCRETSAVISWKTNKASDSLVEYRATGVAGWTAFPLTDTGGVTSHTVALSGLTDGTIYNYRVSSRNSAGFLSTIETDDLGQPLTFTTRAVDRTPPAITATNVSSITTNGAIITWTTNEPSDSLTEYRITGTSVWTASSRADEGGVTSHTVTLSGLNAGTAYDYRVKSRDVSGNEAVGTVSTFRTPDPDVTPPTISNVSVGGIGHDGAAITWTTDEIANSSVEYQVAGAAGWTGASGGDSGEGTIHTVNLSGLTSNTTYNYRVISTDGAGNRRMVEMPAFTFVTTSFPVAEAYVFTGNEVRIMWRLEGAERDALSNKQVEYRTSPSGPWSAPVLLNMDPSCYPQVMLTGLSENTTYYYRVKGQYAAGNWRIVEADEGGQPLSFVTDVTPPVISNVNVSGRSATGATITWTTDEDADSEVRYCSTGNSNRCDNPNNWATVSNPGKSKTHSLTLSGLSSGNEYEYEIWATDRYGNPTFVDYYNGAPLEFNTLPRAQVSSPGYGSNAQIWVSSVSMYKYKLDGGTYSEWPIQARDLPINLTGLSEGQHTLRVIGDTVSGEWQSDANATIVTWTVDTIPPTAVMTGIPPSLTSEASTALNVTGANVRAYKYKLNDGDYSSEIDVNTDINLTAPSEGTYTVRVIGRDLAGNWQSEASATVATWTVRGPATDLTPPSVTGVHVVNVTDTKATIEWTTDDWTNSRVDYRGDGMSVQITPVVDDAFKVKLHRVVLEGLVPNKRYDYGVASQNSSGGFRAYGWGNPEWLSFTTAPTAVINGAPSGLTNSANVTLTVSGGGASAYRYRLDAGEYSAEIPVSNAINLTALGNGSHTVQVIARNAAGAWQSEASASAATWTVDMTPPVISELATSGLHATGVALGWTTDKDSNGAVEYTTDPNNWPEGVMTDAGLAKSHQLTLSGLTPGTRYYFRVKSTDAAGNLTVVESNARGEMLMFATLPLPAAMIAANSRPLQITNATNASLTVTGVQAYKYKFDNDTQYSEEITVETPITRNSFLDGLHRLYVVGRDEAGNWQSEDHATLVEWTVDATPPAGTISIPAQPGVFDVNGTLVTSQKTIMLDVSTSDAGSGVMAMSFSNTNTEGDWSEPETFVQSKSWDLSEGNGSKMVWVRYYDRADNMSAAIPLAVPILLQTLPTAEAVNTTAAEDTPVVVQLVGNDLDGGDTWTYEITGQPSHGALTGLNATSGQVTFTGSADWSGTDTFKYKLKYANGQYSNEATVAVTVTAVNDLPAAVAVNSTTAEDTPVVVQLAGNDIDGGDTWTYEITGQPSHGALTGLNATSGQVTFTGSADWSGTDTFKYKLKYANGQYSNEATVTVTVTPAPAANVLPTAEAVATTAAEDTPVVVQLIGNDPDGGDTWTYEITGQPSHGALTGLNATTGQVIFTGSADWSGTDTFKYKLKYANGQYSNEATVTVTVTAVNDLPTAVAVNATTAEDTPVVLQLAGNDIDGGDTWTYEITGQPSHGALTGLNATTGQVIFTGSADWSGTDTFKYKLKYANDQYSNEATVTVTVTPAPAANVLPTAEAVATTAAEDTPVVVQLIGNDPDGGDTWTYEITGQPSHGALTGLDATTGQVTFTGSADWSGTDTFKYKLKYANGQCSNEATVAVTVTAVNDLPTAVAVNSTTAEDTPVVVQLAGNDIDGGDTWTYEITGQPSHGALTGLNTNTGQVTFTGSADWSGTDTFKYKLKYASGLYSNEATVTVTVTPAANVLPTAEAITKTVEEDTYVKVQLAGNDPDGGDTWTYEISGQPSHGTLTAFNATTGRVYYNGSTNWSGTDTFKYKLKCANGQYSNEATVTVTVTPVNDLPKPVAIHKSILEDMSTSINLAGTDPDGGDTWTYEISSQPLHGTLGGFNATTGTANYAGNANWYGTETFKYRLKYANGDYSTEATVTVTVTAVNDLPRAVAVNATTAQSTPVVVQLAGNDPDGEDTWTYEITGQPSHGALTGLNATTGQVTFTGSADWSGTDTFKYRLVFANGQRSNEATVTVTVTPAAGAAPAAATVNGVMTSIVIDPAMPIVINTNVLTVRYSVAGVAKTKTFINLREGSNSLSITDTDSAGNRINKSFAVTVDTKPPVISAVGVSTVGNIRKISWLTNEKADTFVEYRIAGTLTWLPPSPQVRLDTQGVTIHNWSLPSGLLPNSLYEYRVRSEDALGNESISAVQRFKTA